MNADKFFVEAAVRLVRWLTLSVAGPMVACLAVAAGCSCEAKAADPPRHTGNVQVAGKWYNRFSDGTLRPCAECNAAPAPRATVAHKPDKPSEVPPTPAPAVAAEGRGGRPAAGPGGFFKGRPVRSFVRRVLWGW